jgi:hypothetical protein
VVLGQIGKFKFGALGSGAEGKDSNLVKTTGTQ